MKFQLPDIFQNHSENLYAFISWYEDFKTMNALAASGKFRTKTAQNIHACIMQASQTETKELLKVGSESNKIKTDLM